MTFEQKYKLKAHELWQPEVPFGALQSNRREALSALDPWDLLVYDSSRYNEILPLCHWPMDMWAKGAIPRNLCVALFPEGNPDSGRYPEEAVVPVGRQDPKDKTGAWRIEPWWFNPFKLQMEPARFAHRAPGYRGWKCHCNSGYLRYRSTALSTFEFPQYQQTSQPFGSFFVVGIAIDRATISQSILAKEGKKPWLP